MAMICPECGCDIDAEEALRELRRLAAAYVKAEEDYLRERLRTGIKDIPGWIKRLAASRSALRAHLEGGKDANG